MELTEAGRKLSQEDILRMEAVLKLPLPKEYAAFLSETNGGVPSEDVEFAFTVTDQGTEQSMGSDVQYFYNDEEAMEAYENLVAERLIAPTLFPIACDSFGNEILLCLCAGADYGCVYFSDHESETDDTFWSLAPVAACFSDFIASLSPML